MNLMGQGGNRMRDSGEEKFSAGKSEGERVLTRTIFKGQKSGVNQYLDDKSRNADRQSRQHRSALKKGAVVATIFVLLTSPFLASPPVYAEEGGSPLISIEKPEGWKTGSVTVSITVDTSNMKTGVSISKIEAKAGEDGTWQDVTASGSIAISGNQTVYVRVTDSEGTVYEQNRSIRCYDTEKPTLSASLTDGVLTIQGQDSVSGIASITVNGTAYTDLADGTLKVQLTQKDFTTKQLTLTATDGAGNTSAEYTLQNPYYEWAVSQAAKQSTAESEASSAASASTTTDASGEASTEATVTSPLPQDAGASEPTEAKGTVSERTVTGIEKELAQSGESAESITQTGTEGTKEFYTISTKSGKIFYLVIDNSKSEDNVYFLTEVSEKDLMNFTLSDTVTLPDVDTVYAEEKKEEPEETEVTETPAATEAPTETEAPEPQMPEDQSFAGSYLLIGLAAVGALAGGYYFKVYKPKHEYDDEDEFEEDEEDENSETYEREDQESQMQGGTENTVLHVDGNASGEGTPAAADDGTNVSDGDDGDYYDDDVIEDEAEEDE